MKLEAERLSVGRDWRINVVEDIKDRVSPRICLFKDLPQDESYRLHIEYNLPNLYPYDAENLAYEELRRTIARNLVVPSHDLMNIYVAKEQGSRKQCPH